MMALLTFRLALNSLGAAASLPLVGTWVFRVSVRIETTPFESSSRPLEVTFLEGRSPDILSASVGSQDPSISDSLAVSSAGAELTRDFLTGLQKKNG